jgi:hypothetical protein
MALLTPGYWHSNYWLSRYWHEDYWLEYGVAMPPVGGGFIKHEPPLPTPTPQRISPDLLRLIKDYLELKTRNA